MGEGKECSPQSFLFSSTDSWRLYSPEYRAAKAWRIFYLLWRWCWAIFFAVFLIFTGAAEQTWYDDESQRVKWFIYLTNWGMLAFTIAQLVNTAVCTAGFRLHESSEGIKWYMKLNWFLYEFTSGETILISLLFWALIYDDRYTLTIDTYITHGVNGLHTLIDLWITAMPIKALHFYLPALFGLLYIVFSIIYDYSGGTNALGKTYIYSVLDWNEDATFAAIYSVGAIVGLIVLHFILFGFFKLRVRLYGYCSSRNNSRELNTKTNRYDEVEVSEY
ncbi:protein rolling stone-like [Watersipora subatra]|uniref:protein rolling stone-like n=1 Tax=Watersipora subatra TaxID=2589382 RepID=UPI00355B9217